MVLLGWVAPAERVQPRPVEVSEAPDATSGEVVVEPAQLRLVLSGGTAELAGFRVVNGSEREVSLSVEVVGVGAGTDGAPVVAGSGPGPDEDPVEDPVEVEEVRSAAEWFALPDDEVHLGPSEVAAFRPAVAVPEGTGPGGHVAALRFVGEDFSVAAFVLVVVPPEGVGEEDTGLEGGVGVALRRVDRTSAVASVFLDAGPVGALGVEGSVGVRAWYGRTLVGTELPPTIVLPGVPRIREVTFRAPVIPGPYTVSLDEVVAAAEEAGGARAGEVRFGSATARAWLWNPASVIVLAVALLFLVGWLLWRTVVARRT